MGFLLILMMYLASANACFHYRHGRIHMEIDYGTVHDLRLNETGIGIFLDNYVCHGSDQELHLYDPSRNMYEYRKRLCEEFCQCEKRGEAYSFTYPVENFLHSYGVMVHAIHVKADSCALQREGFFD